MGKTLVYLVHGLGVESEEWWGNTKDTLEKLLEEESGEIEFKYLNYKTRKFDSLGEKIKSFFGKGDALATLNDLGKHFISKLASDESIENADCIMFFCHSMGGLVVANALEYANNVESLRFISHKITHIILCGTPLGGAKLANRAEYLPVSSLHIKELLKDNCSREIISLKLKELTSIHNDRLKTNLSFIRISEDEVVKTDEERYGVFYNQLNGIETPTITGSHSGSVQNMNVINAGIIKRHIAQCLSSDICKDRSKEISEMESKLLRIREVDENIKKQKADYQTQLIDLLIKKQSEKFIYSKEIENNFIDLKIFYRKTFLAECSGDNEESKDRKVILDISRRIKIIDSQKDTIIEFYAGFAKESKEYANREYINTLIEKLKQSMTDPTIDRFKNFTLRVKKKEDKDLLLQVNDVRLELEEKEKSMGINIKINIGKYSKYDEVELLLSYTLPTTIWLPSCKHIPDIITLPPNVLEYEVIIQEEIYNDNKPVLSPRVLRDGELKNIDEYSYITQYYKVYQAKKSFHYGILPDKQFKISVVLEQCG